MMDRNVELNLWRKYFLRKAKYRVNVSDVAGKGKNNKSETNKIKGGYYGNRNTNR